MFNETSRLKATRHSPAEIYGDYTCNDCGESVDGDDMSEFEALANKHYCAECETNKRLAHQAELIENFNRDDMVELFGEASIGTMMNLKVLIMQTLKGDKASNFDEQLLNVFDKLTEE